MPKVIVILSFDVVDENSAARIEAAIEILTKQMSDLGIQVRRENKVK